MRSTSKFKTWWKNHKPTKRRLIQVYASLLYNANLKGFASGEIYKGNTKALCVPGLNCYSCPGAVGACPLGSLQNALAKSKTSSFAYVFGILVLLGLLLGRTVCGFLCPMGLIQELLHKIPSPKLGKSRLTRVASYFKYVILVVLVILIPLAFTDAVPGFCKYICPSGSLLGAIGLLSNENNSELFSMLGPLFTWKFSLLIVFLVGSVFIFRFFCRFFCPLGAIYGFFCKLALLGVRLDRDKCVSCGLCVTSCQMDVRHVGDHECIHCGKCIPVCPTQAIHWNGSNFVIPAEAAAPQADPPDDQAPASMPENTKKVLRRGKILKVATVVLAAALLLTALWYYNIYDRPEAPVATTPTEGTDEEPSQSDKVYGYAVGTFCPDFTLPGLEGDPSFSLADARNEGKVVVINFWADWCTACIKELPYFDRLSVEYGDRVAVVAINDAATPYPAGLIPEKGWADSPIYFAQDMAQSVLSGQTVMELVGRSDALPVTIILDHDGKILFRQIGSITYEALEARVVSALESND